MKTRRSDDPEARVGEHWRIVASGSGPRGGVVVMVPSEPPGHDGDDSEHRVVVEMDHREGRPFFPFTSRRAAMSFATEMCTS